MFTSPMPKKFVWYWTSLYTHSPSSLYEAFEPAEARRILNKLELHFTPKHGSWREYWPKLNFPSWSTSA